ncbi:hypothetical protein BN12_2420011 [Nostocoides japonicum T1-X7]|uniref:Uncharacterized protein n=1 Tax=Nostocoides japonicum T1-X7 TaxID=1194083 RepID=A0A077LVR7_9MICO|nr:hypothetical protein BN12_2420011 [Tetrasphaera japonica T1-X7]
MLTFTLFLKPKAPRPGPARTDDAK